MKKWMEVTRSVEVRDSTVKNFWGVRTPPVAVYEETTSSMITAKATLNNEKLIARVTDVLIT